MRKKRRQDEGKDALALSGGPAPSGRARLTPIDIQQKDFRQQFRGYHMGDVDAFLDELTEDLAAAQEEARRLRDQVAAGATTPLGGTAAAADAQRHAEEIIGEARTEAERILRDARVRVAGAVAGAAGDELRPFLGREREFLQTLAGTIQEHAETVREMASAAARERAARREGAEEGVAPSSEAPSEDRPPEEVGTDTVAMPAVSPPVPVSRPDSSGDAGSRPEPAPDESDRVIRVDAPEEGSTVGGSPAEPVDAPSDEPVDAPSDEPVAAPARTQGPDAARPARSGEDRPPEGSLRDLFWGED